MAKFNKGDLVLTSSQKIIQGEVDILSANGAAEFSSLTVSGAAQLNSANISIDLDVGGDLDITGASALTTLELSLGTIINEFSIDGTLAGDSDSAVPTEKAVKTYVDAQIGGAVPPGTDESIVRYNGVNSVQDSGIFIDDLNNITGVNNIDSTGDITCNDLYVSGSTVYVGEGRLSHQSNVFYLTNDNWGGTINLQTRHNSTGVIHTILEGAPSADTALYYNNEDVFRTRTQGFTIGDGGNARLHMTGSASNNEITTTAPGIGFRIQCRNVGNTDYHSLIDGDPDGSVELFYNGLKSVETTVDGIDVFDTSGANSKINMCNSSGTPMAVLQTTSTITNDLWISATQSAGDIYLATQTSSVGLKIEDGGPVEFYYNGGKVGETTALGISGAVWG